MSDNHADETGNTLSITDVEGPWHDPGFESGLVVRCREYWSTPVSQLPDEMLATFIRQEIGLSIVVPEARRRIQSGITDGTELFDGELAEVLERLRGELGRMRTIATTSEIDDVVSLPKALIFVAAGWAVHSRQSEAAVTKALEANQIDGHRIDVTETQGELWAAFSKWLAHQGQDASRIADCGCGPLLLVQSGRIVGSVLNPAAQRDDLMAMVAACTAPFKPQS